MMRMFALTDSACQAVRAGKAVALVHVASNVRVFWQASVMWRQGLCRKDVMSGFKTPTFEDKRFYLEQLRIQVVIKGEEATCACRLPIGARVFRLRDTRIP